MYRNMRVPNLKGEATPAQIEYVKNIHNVLGFEIPAERTKQAYSDYINRYSNRYKEKQRDQLHMG